MGLWCYNVKGLAGIGGGEEMAEEARAPVSELERAEIP
jgi:hypothetical protein